MRIARKHLGWYTRDLAGSAQARSEFNGAETTHSQTRGRTALLRPARLRAATGWSTARGRGRRARRLALRSRRKATGGNAVGRGGPRRVKRNLRLNGSNEIGRSVERSLDEYFRKLDGESPSGVYDMVIGHVERAMLV